MTTKIKNTLKTTITTLVAIFVVAGTVQAVGGTLTPSGTAGDDTQYSLNDIYDKLIDFTATPTEGSGAMTVPSTVSASFATLSDIYDKLEDEEADLVAGNIADGVEIFGVEGTKKNNPPVTGQTTSYYANDDGDLGSPLSYTDNGDGTVTDNITDLVWQQDGSGSEQSLQDGIDYCVNNEASLPGSGWRLPNYKELASIVDHGRLNPSIDPVFTNTGTGVYMSSTTYIANTDNMWIVSFYNSLIYDDYPKTAPFGSYRVRCVR